jgi:CRP-like cAMP-binding protein
MEVKIFMKGNKLVTEGDECDCIYWILSGKAAVSTKTQDDFQRTQLEILGKGDYIGQWAILHKHECHF